MDERFQYPSPNELATYLRRLANEIEAGNAHGNFSIEYHDRERVEHTWWNGDVLHELRFTGQRHTITVDSMVEVVVGEREPGTNRIRRSLYR